MLTKKALKRWINIALLVGTLACIVAVAVMGRLSLGEKGALVLGYLAALRAVLPTLKGEAEAVIDKSGLPDDDTTTVSSPVDAKYVQAAPLPSSTPTPVTVDIRPKP